MPMSAVARPAVSIIMPAYNGEEFLCECLDSVFAQTLKNIEVICVNDGSTDGTADVLAAYQKRHPNMIVITQDNGGLSAARNAGLSVATGEYVDFLDCDDTLQADALERLYLRASNDELDMLFYDGETIYATEKLREEYPGYEKLYRTKVKIKESILPGEKLFVRLAEGGSYRASACMYLLRLDFLKMCGFAFIQGVYYEDNVFTLQCLLSAHRTGVDPTPYYKRAMRNGSIVTARKNYRHARSYYICQNAIQNFLLSGRFEPKTIKFARQQVVSLMRNAVGVYAGLSGAEKEEALAQYPDAWLISEMMRGTGIAAIQKTTSPDKQAATYAYQWQQGKLKQLVSREYDAGKPFVSVILPVYNAAQYIEETITDLQQQMLNNFEMIFVDDGSEDDSCSIIESYAKNDPRIKLLRQQNCYAGVARNNGMAQAKGEYLLFLDSDDRFSRKLLLHVYACAEKEQAQIVLFHADLLQMPQETYAPAAFLRPCERLPKHVFSAREGQNHIFDVLNPWTKLYNRDFISRLGIQYQPLYSSNDLYFSMVAMASAERIAPLPEVLVHYRVGQTTNIQSRKSKAPLDVYHAFAAVKEELEKRGLFEEFRKPFAVKAAESMLRSLDTMTTLDGYRQLYQILHEGGMEYLEVEGISEEDMQHISSGAMKLARCLAIRDTDYETYMLKSLTTQGTQVPTSALPSFAYEQEIKRLREEVHALRQSYAFRIGGKITRPLHFLRKYIRQK